MANLVRKRCLKPVADRGQARGIDWRLWIGAEQQDEAELAPVLDVVEALSMTGLEFAPHLGEGGAECLEGAEIAAPSMT